MKPLLKEDVYMKIWNKTVPSDNLGRKANEDLKLVVFHTIYKNLNIPLNIQVDFQIHQPLHTEGDDMCQAIDAARKNSD